MYKEPKSQLEDLRGGGGVASTALEHTGPSEPGDSGQLERLRYSACLER